MWRSVCRGCLVNVGCIGNERCGNLADAFDAPICARIVGYDLPVSDAARRYCETTINDPAFKAWRAEGLKVTYDPFPYDMGVEARPWPMG